MDDISYKADQNIALNDSGESSVFTSDDPQEFAKACQQLAKTLSLPETTDNISILSEANALVRKFITSKAGSSGFYAKQLDDDSLSFTLDEIDFGFTSGDDQVDKLLKVLQILYIDDLKSAQLAINSLISKVQAVTADIKVDGSLGQVGR